MLYLLDTVSASDWAQKSPNYHISQCLPTMPPIACSCICANEDTHALISDKKETHEHEENDLSPHTVAIIYHNDSSPNTSLINRRKTCLGF